MPRENNTWKAEVFKDEFSAVQKMFHVICRFFHSLKDSAEMFHQA
jgi:hypothetical protein